MASLRVFHQCDCVSADRTLADPKELAREAPLAHLSIDDDDGVQACCSIWGGEPRLPDGRVPGMIGHFHARNPEAARRVLEEACALLSAVGSRIVVGPINGNTWRKYRLVVDAGTEPPFLMEPTNPQEYPLYFEQAGFTPIANYLSAVNQELSHVDPRFEQTSRDLEILGVRFRNVDLDRFKEELASMHQLSLASFADNYLYSPLSLEQFLKMYLPFAPSLQPHFITIGEADGEVVAFLFTIPDLLQAQRGGKIDTMIAKSIAVHPRMSGQRIGTFLLDRAQQQARTMGMTRMIYALMHEDNRSARIASRFCVPIRRYALFAREVG